MTIWCPISNRVCLNRHCAYENICRDAPDDKPPMTNPNANAAGTVAAGTPTEGEWVAFQDVDGVWLIETGNKYLSEGLILATVDNTWPDEAPSNARLMASSKALLAACEMMLAARDKWPDVTAEETHHAALAMRAAVQRAKGERP